MMVDGFVTDFILIHANIGDHDGAWSLIVLFYQMILIGDKGYIGDDFAENLKTEINNPFTY